MIVKVTADGTVSLGTRQFRCALGRSGIRDDKREGDGATPVGRFPLRRILYRADRLPAPDTRLPAAPIESHDGWCDDPADPMYNRQIRLPCAASHEVLFRDDHLYDVVVVLGHNDNPPLPGRGSAIFMHVARDDYGPTEGCVALKLVDLLEVLAACETGDIVQVLPVTLSPERQK